MTFKAAENRARASWDRYRGAAVCFLVMALLLQGGCKKKADVHGTPEQGGMEEQPRGGDELRLHPLPPPDGEDVVVDPFCGLKMRRSEAAATLEHEGKTFHFCTHDHMEAFKKDPEKHLNIDTSDDL